MGHKDYLNASAGSEHVLLPDLCHEVSPVGQPCLQPAAVLGAAQWRNDADDRHWSESSVQHVIAT
jgi:hypothetical protein